MPTLSCADQLGHAQAGDSINTRSNKKNRNSGSEIRVKNKKACTLMTIEQDEYEKEAMKRIDGARTYRARQM